MIDRLHFIAPNPTATAGATVAVAKPAAAETGVLLLAAARKFTTGKRNAALPLVLNNLRFVPSLRGAIEGGPNMVYR
jgi:hypothetical protein